MPFLERSRANPGSSNQPSFSLTLFDTSYHLQASSPHAQNLLSITNHSVINIHEARRLLGLKAALLHPDDQDWIVAVIMDNEAALHNVAHLIESARHRSAPPPNMPHLDNEKNKESWTLEDDEQARILHHHLSVSHASLMTVLSILYLQDLRWVFTPASGSQPPSDPLPIAPPPRLKRQNRTTRRRRHHHHHIRCATTTTTSESLPTPPSPGPSFPIIDNPYTWQPPPSPPPRGGEPLQHCRSDPTPQSHHHHHQGTIGPPQPSLYRHERIDPVSAYLANCRLTAPWTTEFVALPAAADAADADASGEEGEEEDELELLLPLPPRLEAAGVRRRWSADVLG